MYLNAGRGERIIELLTDLASGRSRYSENLTKLSEGVGVSLDELELALKGSVEISYDSIVSIANYLEVPIDYIIIGNVPDYILLTAEEFKEDRKYFTKYEQIVQNNDMEYIKEFGTEEGLFVRPDSNGFYLLNVAVRYKKYEMVKLIVEQMTTSSREPQYNFITVRRSENSTVNANLYNELRALSIINNDPEGFFAFSRLHNPRGDEAICKLDVNDLIFQAISSSHVTVETLEFLETQKIIDFESLLKTAVQLGNDRLAANSFRVLAERTTFVDTDTFTFIKEEFHKEIEQSIIDKYTFKRKVFNSYFDEIIETAVSLGTPALLEAIYEKGYSNILTKYALLQGKVDLVKKYDDGKDWDRKQHITDFDFDGIESRFIKKFGSPANGKYEYSVISRNPDVLQYLFTKTKQPLRPIEAMVFGDAKLVEQAFNAIPEMVKAKELRSMSVEQLKKFTIDHYVDGYIDLTLQPGKNPSAERAVIFAEMNFAENEPRKAALVIDKYITMIQYAVVDKLSSDITNNENMYYAFFLRRFELGSLGLNFAALRGETDKLAVGCQYATIKQVEDALNLDISLETRNMLEEIIESIEPLATAEETEADVFSEINDITKSFRGNAYFESQVRAIFEANYESFSNGMVESIVKVTIEIRDTVRGIMHDPELIKLLSTAFELFDEGSSALIYLSKLVSGLPVRELEYAAKHANRYKITDKVRRRI